MAAMKNRNAGGLVYSTEAGRMCPACRQPIARCACACTSGPPGDGVVRVARESKGRGGKTVTLVRGLPPDPAALTRLAQQLKTACGSGGTVKDGVIEVQGEHRERVAQLLRLQGHTVKLAGG